ncbi:MAG: hypothetical protein H7829_17405 [Magnetococcus sp. THC-1_WYH]
MIPLSALMMLGKIGGLTANAALAGTSSVAAGDSVLAAGKKVIKVSLAAGKTASKIALTFIQGGVSAVTNKNPKHVEKLSKNIGIVDNELSIPMSFIENQFRKIDHEIKGDLSIIKGQNELLFLSNSIKYFVESHIGRTGLDRGISYALQYDMKAATNHIKENTSLRFPGYLLHQCTCLAETLKELNLFYDAVLNNGHVKDWTVLSAKQELERAFGLDGKEKIIQGYIPFAYRLPAKREIREETKSKRSTWNIKKLFDSGLEDINDAAHDTLFILENELIANENLEYEISQRLEREPEKMLLVESP